MIKKLINIAILAAILYGLYLGAMWGYDKMIGIGTIDRGRQSAIVADRAV